MYLLTLGLLTLGLLTLGLLTHVHVPTHTGLLRRDGFFLLYNIIYYTINELATFESERDEAARLFHGQLASVGVT